MLSEPHFIQGPRRRLISAAIGIAFAATTGLAHADQASDRIADLEKKLEQTLKQLDELSREVRQLKGASAVQAASPKTPAQPASTTQTEINERITGLEQQITSMATRPAANTGVPLHGFADVGLATSTNGRPKGANLGTFDIYLNPQVGDRVKTLIEMAVEVDKDSGEVGVDLERMQIGYTFSDELTVWGGRFHSPFGYWNTAFHHGAQIQTSVTKPKFLEFEDQGGIMPSHTVGVWGNGGSRTGTGKLTYDLYAGNSQRIGLDANGTPGSGSVDPNQLGTTNHNAHVGGNLGYNFGGGLTGLRLGTHAFRFVAEDNAQPTINKTQVTALGGYAVYLENDWEVMSEYYRFTNRDLSGDTGTHLSTAAYVQVGRAYNAWTPYARYEIALLNQQDNYFGQLENGFSYRRAVMGLRYDLNPATALKFELNHTRQLDRGEIGFNEARVQFAVRF